MTTKTLGELILADDPEAMVVLKAWARGENLERHHPTLGWNKKRDSDVVLKHSTYRLAPRDPIIDWSQIGAEIVAVAMDEYGKWRMCTEMPFFDAACSLRKGGFRYNATLWPKAFTPGIRLDGTTRIWPRPKEGE